ncbi:MAG: DUF1800 domain-containing protein [Armatimonadetes bacterium]|nr:DUF1800 domain-containing protein [Armatimonadota bacterium]
MTERDKVAHLLRRFGLGAGRYELRNTEALGTEGTLDRLLDFEKTDEKFPYSPWSFAVQADGKLYTDAYQIAAWWGLRLLMTRRPLQERLALFWHDHFAVSGDKVFEGPTMLAYLEILRQKGAGRFDDLLRAVSKHGALVTYLDAGTSTRHRPNENYAREMFELFTMGIGTYTEADVREAARAFTGWSVHYSGIGDETPYEKLAERAARQGMAMFNFCDVPAHHDSGPKTILGRKGDFGGDDVLDMLAARPETARHLCGKLWRFFAGTEPDAKTLDGLATVWAASQGDVKAVLRAIARAPAFWSGEVVRQMPKSPVDWTVSLFRAFGLSDTFLLLGGVPTDPYAPVKEDLRKIGAGVFYLMAQQGLTLLFPPSVGGWEWGPAWITANNTVSRVNHAQLLFVGDDPNRYLSVTLAAKFKTEDKVSTSEQIVDALADVLDVPLGPEDRTVLSEACTKAGGVKALDDKESASLLFAQLGRLLFALPKAQLC